MLASVVEDRLKIWFARSFLYDLVQAFAVQRRSRHSTYSGHRHRPDGACRGENPAFLRTYRVAERLWSRAGLRKFERHFVDLSRFANAIPLDSASSNILKARKCQQPFHIAETRCESTIRTGSLTCLFAPADRREALFALYAFNIELARIREIVTEPMMGQIRLQWWREAIADLYRGLVRGHQVLQAMAVAIPDTIDQELLQEMIDAREMDLQEEPPVSDIAVKQYARNSGGALMQAAAMLVGVKDPAALNAALDIGEAVTLIGLLRSIPYHAAQGKSYLPSTLLRKLNVPASAPHKAPEYGIEIVTMLIAHEAQRLLRDNRPSVPRNAIAAFLPGRLAMGYIRRLSRLDFDPFRPENLAPSPLKPLDLALAWAFGGS